MAKPLDGVTVTIGGTFPGQTQAKLSAYLKSLGAAFTSGVTKKTTHLITTDTDFATSAKVKQAQSQGCDIVSLEWAQESERLGSKAKEADFAVDGSSSSPSSSSGAAPNGAKSGPAKTNGDSQANGTDSQDTNGTRRSSRKRTAATATVDTNGHDKDEDEDTAPAPQAKKQKASKAKAKAKVEDEDEDEDATPAPAPQAKKQKASKAKAKAEPEPDSQPAVKDEEDKKDVTKDTKKKTNGKANGKTKDAKQEEDTKKDVSSAQVAKSDDIVVPIDEGVPLKSPTVYIDTAGVIWDAALNQTNASNNNNKFYRIQLLQEGKSYKTWTRWGRVGEYGQSALLGSGTLDDALSHFNKKFKDKSGLKWEDRLEAPKMKKYAFVEKNYAPDSDDEDDDDGKNNKGGVKKEEDEEEDKEPPPECTLDKPVQELMSLIFNQQFFANTMTDLNYDANKMPLGKLSKSSITRGFQALKDLSELLDDPSLAGSKYNANMATAVENLSNLFYTVIPHDFGRNRPPVIRDERMLKKELDLLESLSDMKDAAEIMKGDRKKTVDKVHPLDRQFQGLGMDEMTPLDQDGTEFKELADYLTETKGSTHYGQYKKVEQIFRIERAGEKIRFDANQQALGTKNLPNVKTDRRLLWHGSRATNFGGILSQGLRIAPPEAPATGYMFGKGIYLADMSSKSANYCCWGTSDNTALLLLCEAELGDPIQKLTNSSYNAGVDAKKNGMLSTWGQGRTGPKTWKDAGSVHPSLAGINMPDVSDTPGDLDVTGAGLYYNEFIVYDVAQVRLRYLFRVKMS